MEVIRMPEIDQFKPVPNIRVRTYFILRNRVNEEVLRNALDRLIRHHWRKLGARLATRGEDGLLEYHLPNVFEPNYILFNWTSERHDRSIATVGLPKATPHEWGITLQTHIETIEDQLSPPEWPLERKMESQGAPLLFVHLTHFADASCIAINYPHAVADQFGLSNILKAWLGLTRGEEPPQMLGVYNDVLESSKKYTDYKREEVERKGRTRVRRTGEYPLALSASIPDLILHKKELKYTLFIPLPLVDSLQVRHTETLRKKYGSDPGISQNDIIAAILLKIFRLHHKTPRMLALSQTVNARGRIPVLQKDECDGFIHNSAIYSTARFEVGPSTPMSEIAYQNRLALSQAIEPRDAEKCLEIVKEMVRRRQPNLTCEPFERFFHMTSWTVAWKGLDFSSVMATEGKEDSSELLVLGSGAPRNLPSRFITTITCKTSEGYWLNYSAPVKAVRLVKEYLAKDPMLESF